MKNLINKKLIIYGPTATGKTALAIQLARKFRGELISADSRQVYKNLDIGTGKVSFESKVEKYNGFWIVDGVKINGFDLVKPGQQFTVADFLKFTNTTMIRIIEQKSLPIIVGGTGFYIKSLLEGLGTQGIIANYSLRKKLEKQNREELYQHLLKINPLKAKSLNGSDRLNPRRLIRAIEIATTLRTNHSHSGVATTTIESRSYRSVSLRSRMTGRVFLVGLTAPNEYLYKKVDIWLEERIQKGMIEEVDNLIKNGINTSWLENLGLEYKWITRYLKGKIDKQEAVKRLKGDIHNFIRRQKTWLKQYKLIKIFDISQPEWQSQLEKDLKLWYNSHSL